MKQPKSVWWKLATLYGSRFHQRWIGILVHRDYLDFRLYASTADAVFFTNAAQALDRLKLSDPRRYRRAAQCVPEIVCLPGKWNGYFVSQKAYYVSEQYTRDSMYFASAIVHEATHGYLEDRGFSLASAKTHERYELLCLEEQLRFIRRTTHQFEAWTQAQKEDYIKYWEQWAEKRVASKWWLLRNKLMALMRQ